MSAPAPAVSAMSSGELYLRLLRHVRPYWKSFAGGLLAMLLLALTDPAVAALLKPMLDGSFVEKDPQMIRLIPMAIVAIFVVRGISGYVSTFAMSYVANRVVMDLRGHIFDRMLALPARFYANNTTGALVSKINYDASQVTAAATEVIVVVARDSLTVLGLLGWMFWLNWKLSLISLVTAPVMAWIIHAASHRLRRSSTLLQESMGDITHVVEEAVTNQKVVKIFGGQARERSRFHEVSNRVRRHTMKLISVSAAYVPLVQLLAASAMATIVYIASLESAREGFTVGGFMSFFAAMGMLLGPIKRLTSVNERLQRGLAAAASVFALIDQPAERDSGSRNVGRLSGALRFEGVSLAYDDGREVLREIDLDIPAGETLALVGPSGGGKSSLVNLLPRFYDPVRGRILADGIDLHDIRLDDLRRNIALVSQEIVLFNDTIAGNIAYGLGDMDGARVRDAARAAHVLEFADALPNGLDTHIGERGVKLSGGQRQRIAIARAILKDAPILIFDEATSALDTESERHIQAAMEAVRKGRTTLVIAHRLSTIENADRIAVLQDGRIVEVGRHDDLMARDGLYRRLRSIQYGNDVGAASVGQDAR